ncbi:unnamed protein product, partial [Allacma fusca]
SPETESSTTPSILETTTAAEKSTTTTTLEPLSQNEIQTDSLISQNNDSMKQLQLNMLWQLNLSTFDTILLIREAVCKEHFDPIGHTPRIIPIDFETKSSTLENELLQLEGQINQNQTIQQKVCPKLRNILGDSLRLSDIH